MWGIALVEEEEKITIQTSDLGVTIQCQLIDNFFFFFLFF